MRFFQEFLINYFPNFVVCSFNFQNIVHYLSRHGLINFGRYVRSTKISRFLVRDRRSVIVIGAGAAGISAATQLESFGFDVIVLEARNCIGGRIHSFKSKSGEIMETGGDTLRKIEDSPMATLLHQVCAENRWKLRKSRGKLIKNWRFYQKSDFCIKNL